MERNANRQIKKGEEDPSRGKGEKEKREMRRDK